MNKKVYYHKCKSLKEQKKLTRKYLRPIIPLHMRKGKVWHKQYNKWKQFRSHIEMFEYDITTLEELKKYGVSKLDKDIVNDVINNFGKTWKCDDGNVITLIGLCVGNFDYYYIFEHTHGKRFYSTCCGSIEDEAGFAASHFNKQNS